MTPPRMLDVLILTASRAEHDAVLAVDSGAVDGSAWESRMGPGGLRLSVRPYKSHDGGALQVGLALVPVTGEEGAAGVIEALLAEFRAEPRCIVSCGLCVGRRGDVSAGDVILADRVRASDKTVWSLDVRWAWSAARFTAPPDATWLRDRPPPLEAQAGWALMRLADGIDPTSDPERPARCPDWTNVVLDLRARGLLAPRGLALTDAGRAEAGELRLLHPDGLPEAPAWQVHCGPIATSDHRTEGTDLATPGSPADRAALGVDIESGMSAALPGLAAAARCLVVRGVSNLAGAPSDERMRTFAARAAAECALSFLRDQLGALTADDVVDPGTAVLPANPPPSALLSARHRVSPFHGREEMLDDLQAWCAADDTARARLVYADAGSGKTRLAIELCERLRREGWVAGFLREPAPPRWFERLWESERSVLVVLDRAESRATLAALLEPVARNRVGWKRVPFRVLLLARSAGDWWASLTEREGPTKDLLLERSPRALPPLVPPGPERDAIVQAAAAAFAEVRSRPVPSLPELVDDRFDRVLYLHMAALAAVEGVSFTAETLVNDLLAHEERFWIEQARGLHGELPGSVFLDDARRAVAGLTLSGGASTEARASALLEAVNGAADERLLNLLGDLYPGRREGPLGPMRLSALEPDLLGQEMVWRTLCILRGRGDSVESFLDRVFERGGEGALATGFEVLGHLSEDHPAEVRPWIAHLLGRDLPERALVALRAAKAVGARTAHAFLGMELAAALERGGSAELGERLEAAGIPDATVSLREVRAWVAKAQLRMYPRDAESAETLANRARLLINLSSWQRELGQREAALLSAQEAVEILRALVKAHPEAFLSYLAGGLNNLGAMQSELGQREAALLSTQEAVEIRRALAKARPDAFLPDLAMSLNNLGAMQSALGQREAALISTQEAVEISRALAKAHPEAFLPNLAISLNNLGFLLSTIGRPEEALGVTHEAVNIQRALAGRNADAFLPDLVQSLHGFAFHLQTLGRAAEALPFAHEALDILWPLYERLPKAHGEQAGELLRLSADLLKALGQPPDRQWNQRMTRYLALSGS